MSYWATVLWCEECDEIMHWDRHSEMWRCPVCGYDIHQDDTPEED